MNKAVLDKENQRNFLPRWLWLFLPPLLLLSLFLLRYLNRDFYANWFEGELGIVENLTPVLLLPAIICGFLLMQYRKYLPAPWIAVWFLLHAIGAFYFAGEEISWGQHFLGWSTPETLGALNDQNETNLHNISSWFDQKPRLALVLWAIIGGFVTPLLILFGKVGMQGPKHWRYWVLPPQVCMVTGLITALVRVPEDVTFALGKTLTFPFDIRASEVQELFLSLFLTFYLVSVYRRLRAFATQM